MVEDLLNLVVRCGKHGGPSILNVPFVRGALFYFVGTPQRCFWLQLMNVIAG